MFGWPSLGVSTGAVGRTHRWPWPVGTGGRPEWWFGCRLPLP